MSQEIKTSDYTVCSDDNSNTVHFSGELALSNPSEYDPINKLLIALADGAPDTLTLDLRHLEFVNSSGISMLSKFVLGMRKHKDTQVVVLGSNEFSWQSKSLRNLEKLLPGLKLELS
ncbi:MAG: hypothetical protein WCO45_00500 [Pseudanabaena sp. ELA607]